MMNYGSSVLSNGGITGKKTIAGGVNKTVLVGNYIVSVWNTGNTWINGQLQTQTPAKVIGSWRYFEKKLLNVTTISVTGDNIDEVKVYPADAQITTYTYDPLIGMTSQCDVQNKKIYYEYDGFGRLLCIRDENHNVLKYFNYKYQQAANQ
jgi:YD repeat-containing protein